MFKRNVQILKAWEGWVNAAWDSLDTDKSGSIELAELESLLVSESDGQQRLQEARRMLREGDKNWDGRISREVSLNFVQLGSNLPMYLQMVSVSDD